MQHMPLDIVVLVGKPVFMRLAGNGRAFFLLASVGEMG